MRADGYPLRRPPSSHLEARAKTERAHEAPAADGALFEREPVLGLVSAALDGLTAGRGAVLAVEGPHGSGKSAVLDVVSGEARARGLELLVASGRDLEQQLELGVALQLFESRVLSAGEEERERLLSGPAATARPLFETGPWAATDSGDAAALVHGVYRLAVNLAAAGPLVLVVDDADAADATTLRFLLYLAGRISGLPVTLVVAAGSAVDCVDPDALGELLGRPTTLRSRLEPLSPEATSAWLRASFFPDAHEVFCGAVYEASGGSPWLIRELSHDLAARGVDPSATAAPAVHATAPASVAETVMRRARALAPEAADLLEAAAVLGPGTEPRHAAALAGLDRAQAARMGDRLAAAGVLADQDGLTLVHPAVQAAVCSSLPAGVLAEAHLRAARVLADEDAHPEEIARHLLHASRGGGDWVIAVLRRTAARALAQGNAGRAVQLLERARQEPAAEEERAHVLLELGRAEAITGSPDAAGRLTDAIERLPGEQERAQAALDAGRTLLALGRLSDAAAAFEQGVGYAREGTDLGGLLRAARATVLRMLRGRAGVVAEPHEAPADGRTATDRALLAELAIDAALRGEPRERTLELASGALARGALLDDDTADGIAYYLAAAALTISEHLQMAEAALAAAVDDARSRGSALGLATASHFSAYAIMRRGRVPAAAAAAQDALAGRRHGWGLAVPSAQALLAECLIETGDVQGAARQIELAGELDGEDALSRLSVLAGRGRLHLIGNRPQDALTDFMACGDILAAAGAPNPSVLPWRSGASRALWVLGDHDEARLLADEELSLAREFGAPGPIGRALRTLAGMEEGTRAIAPLEEAVSCLEDAPTALERARALVELGSALRRARRPRDARDPLRRGLDLAQRCGAADLAGRAMREVTAAGARPRRTALHGLEALTPRELQTAGLAAEGMSNREIAATLYVTLKTVEWHLKHTYGKLGISSRAELARALAPRPLPPDHRPD